MAPAAAKTIYEHFKDTKRKPSYYDLILTGDLGIYGLDILKEYLEKEYKLKVDNLMDAGALLYKDTGSSIAGASGPTCLPLILFNKILKENKYKKYSWLEQVHFILKRQLILVYQFHLFHMR